MLFASVAVTRILGPEIVGHVGTSRLIMQYLSLSTLGVVFGMGQRVPVLNGMGETERAEGVRADVVRFVWMFSAFWMLLLGIGSLASPLWTDPTGLLVFAGGICMLVAALFQQFWNIDASNRKKFKAISFASMIVAVGALATIPMAYGGLVGGLGRLLFVSAIEIAALALLVKSAFRSSRRFRDMKGTILVGLPIMAQAFLHQFLFVIDRTFVRSLMGAEALGLYSLSTIIVGTALVLPQSLSRVLYPRAGEVFGRTGDPGEVARHLLKPVPYLIGVLLVATPLAFVLVGPAIRLILPEFQDGAGAARYAVLAGALATFSFATVYFSVVGRIRILIVFEVAALVLQFIVMQALYSRGMGLPAFSIATAVGFATLSTMTILWLVRVAMRGKPAAN